ncbi:NAD(P)/FAD-dependent oxidoreductase [Patescibacteria group bacterium]
MKKKKKLVIVGGGFAGLAVAKHILKIAPKEFEVVLVDKNNYHLFTPAFFRATSSILDVSKVFQVVAIKFEDIFGNKKITFLKNKVVKFLPNQNKINLKNKKVVDYDYLVLATGAEPQFPNSSFSSLEDVLRIKTKIEEILKQKAKKEKIDIVVAGAGLVGCELIASLHHYVRNLSVAHSHPRDLIHFKLFEIGSKILPSSSSWIRETALNIFEKMNVEIFTKSQIEKEDLEDVLVWATGKKQNHLIEEFKETSSTLRLKKYKNVFLIKAPTAQSAIHQGKYIARALKKKINNQKISNYKENKSFYIVDFGGNDIFIDFGFLKLKGLFAKFLRHLIFFRYFRNVLGLKKTIKWLKLYRNL